MVDYVGVIEEYTNALMQNADIILAIIGIAVVWGLAFWGISMMED